MTDFTLLVFALVPVNQMVERFGTANACVWHGENDLRDDTEVFHNLWQTLKAAKTNPAIELKKE